MKYEIKHEKHTGHVILPDFLNILQVRKFEDAIGSPTEDDGGRVWVSVPDSKRLPVILEIVQEWHIKGVPDKPTIETFPMTPIKDAHQLVDELFMAIWSIWAGEQVPND